MQNNFWKEVRNFFVNGSVLSRLLGINIIIFLVVSIIRVLFFLFAASAAYDGVINLFGVPANFQTLLYRPWTLFTYMFLHFDFFHILFNMIMLYVGGRLFSEFLGQKRLTGTYVLGGLAGALFFILAYNIFPVFQEIKTVSVAIGASASVLAIFIAISTYMPDYQLPLILLGRIKLKYIAIFFIVIDIISIDQGNAGGHLAHLGGALWGFLYIMMLKKGQDPAKWSGSWIQAISSIFKPKPKLRVEYRSERPMSDDEYNRRKVQNQKRMDEILDKISSRGYESLTSEEKEILFKLSNKE
ncbi:MAG: rhomboid family intramembrane serine protease [Bacteroidales bacterium]